jgi:hypothetical protein
MIISSSIVHSYAGGGDTGIKDDAIGGQYSRVSGYRVL